MLGSGAPAGEGLMKRVVQNAQHCLWSYFLSCDLLIGLLAVHMASRASVPSHLAGSLSTL